MSDKKTDDDKSSQPPLQQGAEVPLNVRNRSSATAKKDNCNDENNLSELSTKEAYFAALNDWVKHANISQNAMALFPWYLISSYPQIFQNQNPVDGVSGVSTSPLIPFWAGAPNLNPNPSSPQISPHQLNHDRDAQAAALIASEVGLFRVLSEQQQTDIINRHGGYEYIVAPIWKRSVAEMIDVIVMLVIKVIITFIIMSVFDLDLGFDLDQQDILRKAIDDDGYRGFLSASMEFLAFSSDLLLLEFMTKVIVCFCEAIFTIMFKGASPGKAVMKLRIYYIEAMVPLQQGPAPQLFFHFNRTPVRALVYPAHVPTFMRALMRAICKNLIMTLLFPITFIMVFYKDNRTLYDVITKTVVVVANPNPAYVNPR